MIPLVAMLLVAAPVVIGSLDEERISDVVNTNRRQIRDCYDAALARKPGLVGNVLVKFVISEAGSVSSAKVMEDSVGDPLLGECVVATVRRWIFPMPRGGGVVLVKYPFTFSPK
jgi:TonB family protein